MKEIIAGIQQFKASSPHSAKAEIERAIAGEFGLQQERSVFRAPTSAFRFSEARGQSFSNTILSLSTLQRYDHEPFIVVVVRPKSVEFLLANSTFLKKISHSSHQLRTDNVKGSFLGHDIMRQWDDVTNEPKHFDYLFSVHRDIPWEDNLIRLVESTTAIVPTGKRFVPTEDELTRILESPLLASETIKQPEFKVLRRTLIEEVNKRRGEIIQAAALDNVNIRGNTIEQIITETTNFHNLSDLSYRLSFGVTVIVDIKTKLLNRLSNPKLYNIDKTLRVLATGEAMFSLLIVAIDLDSGEVIPRLVSIFDTTIVENTRIQFHWAGRASRGVTQLCGNITPILENGYSERIDVEAAQVLLNTFIAL